MGFSLLSPAPATAAQDGKDKIPSIVHPALPPAHVFTPAIRGRVAPALPGAKPLVPEQDKKTPKVKPTCPLENPYHRKMFSPSTMPWFARAFYIHFCGKEM
jgi:hypothetical protein